jgi:MFS family permease
MASAFSRCSFDILLPTLPLILTVNGISDGNVGVIMGIFTFSAIIVRFFSAEGSRRFGLKPFLFSGLITCTIISAAYNWGTTVITAASLRIIHGFGFGIATTLTATIAASVIPAARRGEGFGFLGFGALITAAIAPFLGLWLLDSFGPAVLFAFTAFTQVGCILCIVGVSLEKTPASEANATAGEKLSVTDIVERAALFPSLLAMLLGVCLGSVMCFIPLFSKELHVSNVGWFFLASTLGAFISRLFTGRIFDFYGRSWVLIPGILLNLAGLILIARATSLYDLLIAAVLHGFGSGALFPSLQAWIMNQVVPERHNQANAMFYNAFDIGVGGGSIVLGFIVTAAGYPVMYSVAAAIMATMLAVYICSLVRTAITGQPKRPGQSTAENA